VLLDAGANVECRAQHLLQFAAMGTVYARVALGVQHPRVGLLSIGEEESKGTEVIREAHQLLKGGTLNFIGNIEGRDVYSGTADVIVCDGFTGNVALKISEGLVDAVEQLLGDELQSTFSTRMGYLLSLRAFRRFRKRVDYSEYGGAPRQRALHRRARRVVGEGRAQRRCHGAPVCERARCRSARAGHCRSLGATPVIAFLFPGQGSQKVGMGKALAEEFEECRAVFAEADAALGESLSQLCFEGPEDRLMLTENTQPAILAMSVAAARLLMGRGIRPAFVAGHSLGEYSAHVVAGTLDFADAVRIVRRRGRYMQDAVPVGAGAMAALLGADEALAAQACVEASSGDVVSPANLNGPGQVVIAGARDAVARAGERAKALGARRVVPLPVSAPFHCALMKPAEERLAPELRALAARDPQVPVVANVDAEPKTTARASIDALVAQVSAPVRWEDVVRRLASAGVRAYVEVGPGTVLSGLVRKIQRDARLANFESPGDLEAVEALVRETA
jgi:[acyl-carrier-protein] S-malonyltransferase